MGTREFETSFDVLYNNISSNKAPSLNAYEKSVFLTKAQDELVKNYFFSSGEGLKGFDGNQKRQIDFSYLLVNMAGIYDGTDVVPQIDHRSYIFKLPSNMQILFIVNEALQFVYNEGTSVYESRQVVPISYDEYTRLMQRPYKEPLKNQAWRLLHQRAETANTPPTPPSISHVAEIVLNSTDIKDYSLEDKSDSNVNEHMKYMLRYVKRPRPIILTNLNTAYGPNLKIHGEYEETQCELDESVHEEILQRAVELAKATWNG
jgi:hypothetical protein